MRFRISALAVLAGIIVTAAFAQTQPQQKKDEPLAFVKIAADVAINVQHDTVNGSLGIYISGDNWGSGLKDSDLGPFLKVKEAKPDRSVVCFFREQKDAAVCVYFDGNTPFGVTAVKAGSSGKIEAGDVAATYKPVSKEMLKKSTEELSFTEGEVNADDGQALPAFAVAVSTKSKN
jgi:hypothetical protein